MLVSDLILQYLQQETSGRALPLKTQLFEALRQAIAEQRLQHGMQLPPSRRLARELGVARNTVIRAYERLSDEGYVGGHRGSGTYVFANPDEPPRRGRPLRRSVGTRIRGLSERGATIAAHAASSKIQQGAFVPGIPDVQHFPFALWRRLIAKYLSHSHARLMQYAVGGYGPLKVALAEHLRVSRLINCEPSQIVIVGGAHQGLDLCARLLADPGDSVWVEDPGYWGADNVLRAAGLSLKPIPVDQEGLAPSDEDWSTPPRLIFSSPSYQYPTGAVLSLSRRRQLLERAVDSGAWLIEDDYDNELRYHNEPVASLYALAGGEPVIYVGTFSKVMYPGLRLGYLVVPPELVDAFSTGNAELFREGRLVEQAAVAEFIDQEHFASHIRRMRVVYTERRDALMERLNARLGDEVVLMGGQAGIHLTCLLPKGVNDVLVARQAMTHGVIARPLSMYFHDSHARVPGLVLGYAAASVPQIRRAGDLLADVLEHQVEAAK